MTLMGAFCVHLVVGSQYAWGSLAPYVVGYFNDMGLQTNMSEMYLVLPLIVITSTVFYPVATKLTQLVGSTGIIFLGGCFAVGAAAFASLAT